jgi:subtilisin family serine protease
MRFLRQLSVTFAFAVLATLPTCGRVAADTTEGAVDDRILVVFRASTVPPDAVATVESAGGRIVLTLQSAGIVVAEPVTADATSLLAALRSDPRTAAAAYDRLLPLGLTDDARGDASEPAAGHLAHPSPFSPLLPPDFAYASGFLQWAVKRIGGQGAGIPGGGAGAWDITLGRGARIAILDSGVAPHHPDLTGRIVFDHVLTSHHPSFGEPNCEVPDPANPPFDLPIDQNGHGTGMASLAAGSVGGGFVIGMAPEADILNIKVLRNRAATPEELAARGLPDTPFNRCRVRATGTLLSWVLAGIVLASEQGADVISMSLGTVRARNSADGAALWSAFNRVTNLAAARGALLVAAAGNTARDMDRDRSLVQLPASSPNVITVVATTNPDPLLTPPPAPAGPACGAGEDCLASYSNYGTSLHGLAAPGGDEPAGACTVDGVCEPTGFIVVACTPGLPGTLQPVAAGYPAVGPPPPGRSWGCSRNAFGEHAWYKGTTGTSAATALVAGAAALVKAANPALGPAEIRTILLQTAEDIGRSGYDQLFNHGLVDAAAAVRAAAMRSRW